MWEYPHAYEVIVMGGGHAGCEAALAAARRGACTLLLTMNLDTIAKMSCNPAIGGIGKGHMVREIDALGGEMGQVIDVTGIQYRMLNATRGPAVWAPRAQADKVAYQNEMKRRLEATPGLEIKQATIEELLTEDGAIVGVSTKEGIIYRCRALVISSGTFMRGLLHIGDNQYEGGRAGDQPARGLSASLERLGLKLGRLKTGTPPRVHARSIDYALTEEQPGDAGIYFSFDADASWPRLPQVCCHITYTTAETKRIIEANIARSPLYSGKVDAVGPRYCPSIEDKVVRFSDKERHQLFLEPEGLHTDEVYINGISSSLPLDVQYAFIRSIPALRDAEIMRPAYAIEYDYVVSGQLAPSLETRAIKGLFLAGQINGTTGYEEAAAQGLMAGINACSAVWDCEPFILKRSEAYIGVMIDDLITKGVTEPYRMFTSRAEYRLLLRQDNADLRLRDYGHALGLIDVTRYQRLQQKRAVIEEEKKRLLTTFKQQGKRGLSMGQLLAQPGNSYASLIEQYPNVLIDHGSEINRQVELHFKYAGYIERQQSEVNKLRHLEDRVIPSSLIFSSIVGLRNEAKEKLDFHNPKTVGQAMRISGISPADVTVLMVAIEKATR